MSGATEDSILDEVAAEQGVSIETAHVVRLKPDTTYDCTRGPAEAGHYVRLHTRSG